jgi:glucose-6-phosphate 1-dehydrogenase
LAKRITEITIFFKRPPGSLFHGRHALSLENNVLAIQVQPHEGISFKINSKPPGPRMRVRPVEMDFSYGDSFGIASPDAYERLLLDAMKGDATLFTRNDEIEQAWSILMPILERWENDRSNGLYGYESGTWGPKQAELLIEQSGRSWRKL